MNIKERFGNRLKALRMERNMSQADLAFEAGIDRSYIPGIEQGKRNISIEIAEKLAKALNIPITEFFTD